MPRPPILPRLDWRAIFDTAATFKEWISGGDSHGNREKMLQTLGDPLLEPADHLRVAGLLRPIHVVAIAEDWCGDVVRHVPVLEALASVSDKLRVGYVSRARHPDVLARFLTNGGEAIPKFIFLNEEFVECGNWGPMPARCRVLIARGKACGDLPTARKKVAELYAADPGRRETVEELLELIEIATALQP